MPRRHCPKCHYLESDDRFRKRNPKNQATTKHFCPRNSKKHSFAACPTHYEAGHRQEVAEIKERQRMEKKLAETEKKNAELAAKEAEKKRKQQEREQKKAEEDQKKAGAQKLRERRLARKLPEFKEYLRNAGICQEASPNYLAQLMTVLRRYVSELKDELHPNNERKRKRNEQIEPYTFEQVVAEIYCDEERPQKRSRIYEDEDEPSKSDDEEEELLRNNNRPPTQPPDPNAQHLEFETSSSGEEDEQVIQPPKAANNGVNNNMINCDDGDDYEPLYIRTQNAHLEDSGRILDVNDLDPVQFLALRSFLDSLRNEAKDDDSQS